MHARVCNVCVRMRPFVVERTSEMIIEMTQIASRLYHMNAPRTPHGISVRLLGWRSDSIEPHIPWISTSAHESERSAIAWMANLSRGEGTR